VEASTLPFDSPTKFAAALHFPKTNFMRKWNRSSVQHLFILTGIFRHTRGEWFMDEQFIGYLCAGSVIFLVFIGGVLATIFGIRNRRKGSASQNWPAAGGIITKAWIQESTDTDEEGYTSTSYTPKWEYEFKVGQETFTSSRVSFGGVTGYGRQKRAQEELNRFPANSKVRVYYDPTNPGDAVLVRGTKGTMGGIIIGIVLIVLSACGSCFWLYTLLDNLQVF
jgi:hypothetical protein